MEAARKSKREELEERSDEELEAHYEDIYKVAPDEGTAREDLIEAIISGTEELPSPKENVLDDEDDDEPQYGNNDKDEEHPLPKSLTEKEGWDDQYIVYQVQTRVVEGEIVPLKSTGTIQAYKPEKFEQLLKSKFFQQSKMEVTILHKP